MDVVFVVAQTNAVNFAIQAVILIVEGSQWLLAGGVWSDSGVWDDTAVWID